MSIADQKSLAFWRSLPPMYITLREALALPEYSGSNPTGAYPGKRWRRHNGVHDMAFKAAGGVPRWIICEEVPENDKIGRYRPASE